MIAIACDHAGYERKLDIIKFLEKNGVEFMDLGTNSTDSVDYPAFAKLVAEKIVSKECEKGILICGSGIGMSIAVNRYIGVRGALCLNKKMAKLSRQHNNANVLCLPARNFPLCKTKIIIKAFLSANFEGGRHIKRVEMIDEI